MALGRRLRGRRQGRRVDSGREGDSSLPSRSFWLNWELMRYTPYIGGGEYTRVWTILCIVLGVYRYWSSPPRTTLGSGLGGGDGNASASPRIGIDDYYLTASPECDGRTTSRQR